MAKSDEATRAEILSVVICDQVRKENNRKDILIGAYGRDIVVSEFAAFLTLTIWIEHVFYGTGDLPLYFKLTTDRGTELFNAQFTATLRHERSPGSISLGEFGVPLTDPCQVIFQFKEHDGDWIHLKSKTVLSRPQGSGKAA